MESVPVTFLVDTGANITIMKSSVLQQIARESLTILQDQQTSMTLADGNSLPFLRRIKAELKAGPLTVRHDIWIANNCYLGRKAPSLKIGSICFSYYYNFLFFGGRLPVLC